MIPQKTLDKLELNWGDVAEGMACKCELRIFDPTSSRELYVYAINQDDDLFKAVYADSKTVDNIQEQFHELVMYLREMPDAFQIDNYYVPRNINEVYKKLKEMRNESN